MERVKAVVAQQFDIDEDEVTSDTSFKDLGADQLDIAEFLDALSDEFELDMPDFLLDSLETVGDAVDYIKGEIE